MNKRMTISLSPELNEDLQTIISNRKYDVRNKAEAFRNSIVMYKLILDELDNGNKLVFADKDNNIIKEIVI